MLCAAVICLLRKVLLNRAFWFAHLSHIRMMQGTDRLGWQLQVALIGMNGELMGQYIEFVADRLLHVLGSEKIYKTKCPFEWMEQLSLQ